MAKVGRKSKYHTHVVPNWEIIKDLCRNGATDATICKRIDVNHDSFCKYKKLFPEFAEILKRTKDYIDSQVENALLKRALGYRTTEVTKERIQDTRQKSRHKDDGDMTLTEGDWEFAVTYFNDRCCYCGEEKDLTRDHLIPLDSGGEFHRNNIVPCCQSCNSSKKNNEFETWFKKQKFYSEYKVKKILDYIIFIENLELKENNYSLVITKEVVRDVAPDVVAQIFWLKNRRKDEWKNKPEDKINDESVIKEFVSALRNIK